MLKRFLIILLLLLLFPPAASAKGRVAGKPVADYPFSVVFHNPDPDVFNTCAGVLIRPRWVLSSATYCLDDRDKRTVAYVGATRRSPYNGVLSGIEQVYTHPRHWQGEPDWLLTPSRNISLVRLSRSVDVDRLPPLANRKPKPGEEIKVAGLGFSQNLLTGDENYPFLLEGSADVRPDKYCQNILPDQGPRHRTLFCAFSPWEGPCALDEGAGAFQNGELVGIFNSLLERDGDPTCPREEGAGTYTSVSSSKSWIEDTLRRGYAPGRFLDYGVFLFSGRKFNSFLWANQEIVTPQIRFFGQACYPGGNRCLKKGKWISLSENMSEYSLPGEKGTYWMLPSQLAWRGGGKCPRGEVRAFFEYQGKKEIVKRAFRNCREGTSVE